MGKAVELKDADFATEITESSMPVLVDFIRTRKWKFDEANAFMNRQALSMSLLGIMFYLVIECFVHAYIICEVTLPSASQQAMFWVRDNTPAESSFLILTGRPDVMTDPVQEWFPIFAERHSATTLQGLEWTLGRDFYRRWDQLSALQMCNEAICVKGKTSQIGIEYDYVILDLHQSAPGLFASLLEEGYVESYENGQYVILKSDSRHE